MEYFRAIKIVTDMDAEHVEHTINYAFCCEVVTRVETVGDTKIIHLKHGLARGWMWWEFYEALERGSVWISSEKREKDEYDESMDSFAFSETLKECHWEVCYAEKSNKKLCLSRGMGYWETDEEPVVPCDLGWFRNYCRDEQQFKWAMSILEPGQARVPRVLGTSF